MWQPQHHRSCYTNIGSHDNNPVCSTRTCCIWLSRDRAVRACSSSSCCCPATNNKSQPTQHQAAAIKGAAGLEEDEAASPRSDLQGEDLAPDLQEQPPDEANSSQHYRSACRAAGHAAGRSGQLLWAGSHMLRRQQAWWPARACCGR